MVVSFLSIGFRIVGVVIRALINSAFPGSPPFVRHQLYGTFSFNMFLWDGGPERRGGKPAMEDSHAPPRFDKFKLRIRVSHAGRLSL